MKSVPPIRRRERIMEHIRRARECRIAELAQRLGVSEMTVRRDLDALAAEGQVVRTHGGAAAGAGVMFRFRFLEREREHRRAKDAIAQRAAELVRDGQTLILDSGTTTLALARRLRAGLRLTVITTSLPIASELQYCETVETILLGGRLRHDTPDLSGAFTLRMIAELHADLAFLGTDAIDNEGTCYHASIDVAQLVAAMAAAADAVYVVADSSKIGRTALARMGSLRDWQALITDTALPAAPARVLRDAGVTLLKPKRQPNERNQA